jgi:hypothetical protein
MSELLLGQLNDLFEYKDKNLYWKNPPNKKNAGKVAGFDSGNGYKRVEIAGKQYFVHRIVFYMNHKYLPKTIDHIDGNGTNNAIENLREATNSQNMMNSLFKKKTFSGCRNVSYNKARQKWCVYIKVQNKPIFYGSYKDLELADLVAQEARDLHFGQFARHA